MELTNTQRASVDGLRELADFLEANPELLDLTSHHTMYAFPHGDKANFARVALLLGPSAKSADADWYNVERKFGPKVTIQVTARREEVCERTVVGTETVTEFERDTDAVAAAIADIPRTAVTRTVEKIEWVCPPSLHELAGGAI